MKEISRDRQRQVLNRHGTPRLIYNFLTEGQRAYEVTPVVLFGSLTSTGTCRSVHWQLRSKVDRVAFDQALRLRFSEVFF